MLNVQARVYYTIVALRCAQSASRNEDTATLHQGGQQRRAPRAGDVISSRRPRALMRVCAHEHIILIPTDQLEASNACSVSECLQFPDHQQKLRQLALSTPFAFQRIKQERVYTRRNLLLLPTVFCVTPFAFIFPVVGRRGLCTFRVNCPPWRHTSKMVRLQLPVGSSPMRAVSQTSMIHNAACRLMVRPIEGWQHPW